MLITHNVVSSVNLMVGAAAEKALLILSLSKPSAIEYNIITLDLHALTHNIHITAWTLHAWETLSNYCGQNSCQKCQNGIVMPYMNLVTLTALCYTSAH